MRVSLREARLVLERLALVARVDGGLVPAVRDCAMFSAMRRGGFDHVGREMAALGDGLPALAPADDTDGVTIGCGAAHAWLVADALVDVAVDLYRRGRPAAVRAMDVAAPEELAVIPFLAERHGLAATVQRGTIRVVGGKIPTTLDEIRRDGLPVDAATWWALFARANDALVPDSYESRRHAGPIMVDADGRVIGRSDEDETDLALLGKSAAAGGENMEC